MRTFVLGDSHGGAKALVQVFERAGFDYEQDKLICLGDVADGWPEVPELIEELLKVKNLIVVRGNHDDWLLKFLETGWQEDIWVLQGGQASREAYLFRRPELMPKHCLFLQKTPYYYIDEENRLFVHGGYKLGVHPKDTDPRYLMWDRDLWDDRHRSDVKRQTVMQFKEVYVGHTSIYRFSHKPVCNQNVWFMDTGGGWEGVLSMMNIDTKEVFQSDPVKDLYPKAKGRN